MCWGFEEIQQGLRMASAEHPHIESVGVDTWGVDYVLVDGSDQVTGVCDAIETSESKE